MEEVAVLYHLPSHIIGVEAPEGTVALTKEEYLTLCVDSWDISVGSPPPPRPAHLKHLPQPEGLDSAKRVQDLKRSKDQDGLSLHERTEFDWFKIRR